MQKEATLKALVEAESDDMGKPVAMMESIDMPCSMDQLQVMSRMAQSAFEHRNPIGIVALICPWNFPLLIFCTKIAPALVCPTC